MVCSLPHMKRWKKRLLIVGAALTVIVVYPAIVLLNGIGHIQAMVINDVDLSQVSDGRHEGEFSWARWRYAVEVTVKDHRMEAIELRKGTAANNTTRKAVEEMLRSQRVKIDAVTGATVTTKAFSKAVENALAQGQ